MLHVLKRLVLVAVGYLVGLLVGLLTVVVVYVVLSSLPGAPSYFDAMSLTPIVVLAAPWVGVFVYGLAGVLTCLPALVLSLLTELFSLRALWLFAPAGALIGVGAFLYLTPELLGPIDGTDWADLAIIAVGGLAGGATYWLIAGRRAGFIREALPVARPAV